MQCIVKIMLMLLYYSTYLLFIILLHLRTFIDFIVNILHAFHVFI